MRTFILLFILSCVVKAQDTALVKNIYIGLGNKASTEIVRFQYFKFTDPMKWDTSEMNIFKRIVTKYSGKFANDNLLRLVLSYDKNLSKNLAIRLSRQIKNSTPYSNLIGQTVSAYSISNFKLVTGKLISVTNSENIAVILVTDDIIVICNLLTLR
jgi:hypothetical protein